MRLYILLLGLVVVLAISQPSRGDVTLLVHTTIRSGNSTPVGGSYTVYLSGSKMRSDASMSAPSDKTPDMLTHIIDSVSGADIDIFSSDKVYSVHNYRKTIGKYSTGGNSKS